MIWPILARYMVAFTAGATWLADPLFGRVLWGLVLFLLVVRDARGALRREEFRVWRGLRRVPEEDE